MSATPRWKCGIDTVRGEHAGTAVVFTGAPELRAERSLQSWFGVDDLVFARFHQNTTRTAGSTCATTRFSRRRTGSHDADAADGNRAARRKSFFSMRAPRSLAPGEMIVLHAISRWANPVTIRWSKPPDHQRAAGRFAAVAVRPIFQSGACSAGGQALICSARRPRVPRGSASLPLAHLDMSLRTRN